MKFIIFSLLLLSISTSFALTDLGKKGNLYAFKKYQNYIAKKNHCLNDANTSHKVLVASFGPWGTLGPNISESVASLLAGSSLKLKEESFGGEVFQKELILKGRPVNICFVNLEVLWDLSTAVLLYEASKFQPDFILMLGHGVTGKIIIEAKAKNYLAKDSGYNYQGQDLKKLNTPIRTQVLPNKLGVSRFEEMTWKRLSIADALKKIMPQSPTPLKLYVPFGHRRKNIYICNALSLGILHALKNKPIELFKSLLSLRPDFNQETTAGFLHLPSLKLKEQTPLMLNFLSEVIEETIFAELNITQ